MSIMGWTEMATAQRYTHAVDELRRGATGADLGELATECLERLLHVAIEGVEVLVHAQFPSWAATSAAKSADFFSSPSPST